MRVAPIVAVVLSLSSPAAASDDDLAVLNDEFDGPALAADWRLFHESYGWPNKIRAMDVGRTEPGALHLAPHHSAWVRDLNAPFLFRSVEGDFDMRARVRVRGLNGAVPGGTWSLGGLMARVPNDVTAATWRPRAENWHFITTGVGHEAGRVMTETKGTYNSYSSLRLRPYQSGWVELRLVRVGMALFALARPDGGGPWQVRDRFYRMENSRVMQAGLIAYTHSPDIPQGPDDTERSNREVRRDAAVDMAMDVDWIRFSRPRPAAIDGWYPQVSGDNPLTDPNLTEAQILEALGS
jgi:hypothetical protein